MLRKGAFIMRVEEIDSDAVKLYESSYVKFKTTGTIREVQFTAGVNKSCAIQKHSFSSVRHQCNTRDGRFRMGAEHNGMKYATVGLDQMTDEQIAIYNYLYYYDKEEAEAYITLIQPYLGTKKAYEKYGEIKDSTFQKAQCQAL